MARSEFLAGAPVQAWLDKAQSLTPLLNETVQAPLALVHAVADPAHPLRYRMQRDAAPETLAATAFRKGDSFVLDFGGHRTGHLSFRLESEGGYPDSPVRLRLIFGEVPPDVAEPFYPYTGKLSQAWLPDETINIDDLPQAVCLPRRYAFRHVKIEIVDTSPEFGVRFHDVRAHALTAAVTAPPPLRPDTDALVRRIDDVSIATLRDCLQTVFEDGPRRDRRLWVGDLRLQALANYATFRCNDVVRRCLYLFAALPREDGLVSACVYERPAPRTGEIVIFDYAALYNVTLKEYVDATGDLETANELWPVAKRQLEILGRHVDANGLFVDPRDIWLFIDWAEPLDRTASIQGVLIHAYRQTLALATRLGRAGEVADYAPRIAQMIAAARRAFFDPARKLFVSGPERQVSWASQAWLAIAGVPESKRQGALALRRALADMAAIRPVTPYLHHHIVEAMLALGMRAEALALVKSYWGGMVAAGADTFWEIYDPDNPLSSPYGDIRINSYCHAWSCTPTWFFRTRGLGLPVWRR